MSKHQCWGQFHLLLETSGMLKWVKKEPLGSYHGWPDHTRANLSFLVIMLLTIGEFQLGMFDY